MRSRSATSRSAAGRTSSRALLASSGVNRRSSGTAPAHRMDGPARLAGWLILVGLMIAIAYAARATEGKPDPQILYHWSTAIGGIVQDGIILLLVLGLAARDRDLLALRRPRSIPLALLYIAIAIVVVYIFEGLYGALTHPGNEQGLTPSHWEPAHAAAYVVNGIVICTVIPFVEELTFRGLGYSLLERLRPLAGDLRGRPAVRPRARARRLAAGDRVLRRRARVDPLPDAERVPGDASARDVQPDRVDRGRHSQQRLRRRLHSGGASHRSRRAGRAGVRTGLARRWSMRGHDDARTRRGAADGHVHRSLLVDRVRLELR